MKDQDNKISITESGEYFEPSIEGIVAREAAPMTVASGATPPVDVGTISSSPARDPEPIAFRQTEELLDIAKGVVCFSDERRTAYGVVEDEKSRQNLRLAGSDFALWLSGAYFKKTGRGARKDAVSTAVGTLSAKARFGGKQVTLSNRFARPKPGEIWIDLGDDAWRAVRLTVDGWEIVEKPPTIFRRYSHQQPLPEPVPGGDLLKLRKFINVERTDDALLIFAWLVSALIVDIPHPVLCLYGTQGSAKTTAARMLRSLLDPSAAPTLNLGSSRDLVQNLDHHAVPIFDNLASLTAAQSNQLCMAVTGAGSSTRQLFTDDEALVRSYKRPIILTGVHAPMTAPDLLDRTLMIQLKRIPPEERRPEEEIWGDFEDLRPKLLGALLTTAARTMKEVPGIRLTGLPRMADFARWGAAVSVAIGKSVAEFSRAVDANTGRQREEVLEGNAFVVALRDFIRKVKKWQGSAASLLKELDEAYPTCKGRSGWPDSPEAVGKCISAIEATLVDMGYSIERGRTAEGRFWEFRAPESEPS